jgi:hypothetical protein
MKVQIQDESALRAVRPLDVAAYLRSKEWREVNVSDPLTLWEKLGEDGQPSEVEIPQHPTWRDYSTRVAELLESLAQVEGRSQLAIIRDIAEVSADVIRLRAADNGPNDGTIQVADGLRLWGAADRLMMAAACATILPKRAYPARRPTRAIEYVDGLRFGQSERGSYVITLISPVSPLFLPTPLIAESGQTTFPFAASPRLIENPTEPFERKVTRMLATSLSAVARAAQHAIANSSLDAFEEAVTSGVSADLCEGLAQFEGRTAFARVEFRFAWAPARPSPDPLPTIIDFTDATLKVIGQAGRQLRAATPVENFELLGVVVKLTRPGGPGDSFEGEAVVQTIVDNIFRQVTIELFGQVDWETADRAMRAKEQLFLRCEGELIRTTKPFRLIRARKLRVLTVGSDGQPVEPVDP